MQLVVERLESRDCPAGGYWAHPEGMPVVRVLFMDTLHPAALYQPPPSSPLVRPEASHPGDPTAAIAKLAEIQPEVRQFVLDRGGHVETFAPTASVDDLPELASDAGHFHGGTVGVTVLSAHTTYLRADSAWALPHEWGHLFSSFLPVDVFNDYGLRVHPAVDWHKFPLMGNFSVTYFSSEPVESMANSWWAFNSHRSLLEPLLDAYWSGVYVGLGLPLPA